MFPKHCYITLIFSGIFQHNETHTASFNSVSSPSISSPFISFPIAQFLDYTLNEASTLQFCNQCSCTLAIDGIAIWGIYHQLVSRASTSLLHLTIYNMYKDFPSLSPENEKELVEKLSHWALANGLVMYPPQWQLHSASNAPITMFPTPFPRDLFENAMKVQTVFNELYANVVSHEKVWLVDLIKSLAKFDKDFTGKLYETYVKAVEQSGGTLPQPLSLGVFRSDYMYNQTDHSVKQIEFNTVSISFGGLSTKVGKAQNYLNDSGAYDDNYSLKYYPLDDIPVSESIAKIADGLAAGNYFYNDENDNKKTVVLFVVQPGERNCFDQRLVEYALLEKHGIKSYRSTLEEIKEKTTINSGKLYIKATMDEVFVVYYRSGYAPSDYSMDPEKTWDARLHLELSKAIKCPSLLTQLSGSKKIQQVLTDPEIVKAFLKDSSPEEIDLLLSTFVKIHPLDDTEAGKKAKRLAFDEPQKFVLKPQREGGGNNVYKEDIPGHLKSLDESEWGAYVLMELIHPPTHKNKLIKEGQIYHEDIVSELGIFGTIVFNEETGEIKSNENAGFLLRSKFSSSDEGGVAAGFGCVDSVYLY